MNKKNDLVHHSEPFIFILRRVWLNCRGSNLSLLLKLPESWGYRHAAQYKPQYCPRREKQSREWTSKKTDLCLYFQFAFLKLTCMAQPHLLGLVLLSTATKHKPFIEVLGPFLSCTGLEISLEISSQGRVRGRKYSVQGLCSPPFNACNSPGDKSGGSCPAEGLAPPEIHSGWQQQQ